MLNLGQGNARPSIANLRAALIATTILTSGFASSVMAATQPGSLAPPPVRRALDGNGVDVIRATFNSSQPSVSIGTSDKGLSYDADNMGDGWVSDLRSGIVLSGSTAIVTINGQSTSFAKSGSTYTSTEGEGATLTQNTVNLTFTARDGTVAALLQNTSGSPYWDAGYARVTSITAPNGVRTDFTWKVTSYCPGGTEPNPQTCPSGFKNALRLQAVTNTNGFQLKLSYASNALNDLNIGQTYDDWSRLTSVKGINNGVEYCDPSADTCSLTNAWPTLTFSGVGVTDSLNRTTTYGSTTNGGGQRVDTIKRPGASTPNITVTYAIGVGVQSVLNEGVTYSYSFADSSTFTTPGNIRTTTVTSPTGNVVYTSDTIAFRVKTYSDELGRTTSYAYDGNGRVTRVTMPEGNYTDYTYDARGNRTQTRYVAKAGSGLADIVETAVFPATCTNVVTCNKPTSTTDAKGNVTNYSYDATHGGLLSATSPAPATGGIRPEVRMTYGTAQAYYKNGGGSIVASGQNHYVLTATSTCQTAASCASGADEIKTTIGYGPQVAGTANNLYPVTASKGSGDGALIATTSVGYDGVGNVVSVDGPLAGTADTSVAFYDAARQVTGTISPDPDGAGALKNRAHRLTYNLDGQVTKTEVGTTTGQSASAFAAFAPLQQTIAAYDANARKASDTVQVGSTNYALTQYSYDGKGRLDCTAVRMNTAVYGSLPGACTASALGSAGPDRITRSTYNAADQATKVQTAYGTADQADEQSITLYTQNGKPYWLVDANNNVTTYVYDGFDRLSRVDMPSPTTPGNGSPTDYEDYFYDANGNVVQRRLRDGQLVNYSFDNLNRLTTLTPPNIGNVDQAVSYTYDNLGRTINATKSPGFATTFAYDALNRVTGETGLASSMTYQYDLVGRRTRSTWSDGFYVTYGRDVLGEITRINENGAASGIGVLGTYSYDDLGRRTQLLRGNGMVTTYGYDPVSRMASLAHDFGGAANDVTTTFAYNPASQITSSARSNDAYAWNGHYNVDRPYTVDGINQLTSAGSTTLGYDGRGNLTSSGSQVYDYNAANTLWHAHGQTFMFRDAFERLQYNAPDYAIFGYDGSDLVTETQYTGPWQPVPTASTGSIVRRYVRGPGTDEILVWYEGSGTIDRRWLAQDERGSTIAIANDAGTVTNTLTYDEYGIPGAGNTGRFQYTGQAWIAAIGMYDYKARIYSPTLGRFMQADPIGYGAGMNMYAYVGGDPVNFVDPFGLSSKANEPPPANSKPATQNGTGCDADTCGPDLVVTAQDWTKAFRGASLGFYNYAGGRNGFASGGNFVTRRARVTPQKKEPARHCYGPPQGPAGISASELASQSKINGDAAAQHPSTDLEYFYSQVRNNGPQDYKQYDRAFQNYGNYNFGYVGTRQGIAAPVLRAGAGYAQVRAGTSSLSFITSAFDDPKDREQIDRGIEDAQNECY